jgi:radical SAM protein with 4Fe4S-binding SPASM domain
MPDCKLDLSWAEERLRRTFEQAWARRILMSLQLDLTYRCNLRCVHCYTGHRVAEGSALAAEMTTRQARSLLSQAADLGCLHLLISGGEPLLRGDFPEVYAAARLLGMTVTVFTNATLVSNEHLAVFSEFPPQMVEVSIYGASEAVTERVTGVRGSFGRSMLGVERLLGGGVPVVLKSMILSENVGEASAMAELAERLGVGFRLDPLVNARLDGDRAPLDHRVAAGEAVPLELPTVKKLDALREYADTHAEEAASDRYFECGAAAMSAHLDPQGMLRPCLLSRTPAFDSVTLGLGEAWQELVAAVDGLSRGENACRTCKLRVVCGQCPALFSLETGTPGRHSEYVCELGEARAAAIGLANHKAIGVGQHAGQ